MNLRESLIAALPVVAAASGCAKMKPQPGFDSVRQGVSDRAGLRVHWNSGSAADAEVRAAIDRMLAEELTAARAVQITLLNNRDLQAVYEELNLAQADLVRAGLLRNPIFSVEARFDTEGGGTGFALEVAQDFMSLLYMPLRKGRAQAAFEAAKVRVTGGVLDAALAARTAFIEYQAAEQTREMRAAIVDATAASYELAMRLRQAGNNLELDVINERALHEESKVALAASEEAVLQARERLNAAMGLWGPQTQWASSPRLPPVPDEAPAADGLESRAIQASLDLALLRREVEIAAREARIARPYGWLDDAEVGVAAEREVEGGWSVGPALSAPLPIFDQGQASLAGARARVRQSSERHAARAVELRAIVRAAYSAVLAAHDRAHYYEQVLLPLRERIVEETQLQYNAMQVGAFQLLQSKRDQIETGTRYIESVRDYWLARARLDHTLSGRMLPFGPALAERTSTPAAPASGRDGGH